MISKELIEILEESKKETINLNISNGNNENMFNEHINLEVFIKNVLSLKTIKEYLSNEQIDIYSILASFEDYIKSVSLDESYNPGLNDIMLIDILARASLYSSMSGSSEVNEFNIIESVLKSEKTKSFSILTENNVKLSLFETSPKKSTVSEEINERLEELREEEEFGSSKRLRRNQSESMVDLVKMAKEGKIEDIYGREEETLRISTILSRKTKNNPIIIGEAGVGKTAIVEALAKSIADDTCIEELRGKKIYSLSIHSLVSGSKYRGEFEEKAQRVIEKIKGENAILFIDEIHTALGSNVDGREDSIQDLSKILLPHLTSGDLSVIGVTTNDKYLRYFESNQALNRRFNKVEIKELSQEDTIKLLKRKKGLYENYHNVSISDELIEKIVMLSGKYINDNNFPDKALDVLDEVSTNLKVSKKSKNVSEADVIKVVSKISKLPEESIKISGTNKSILKLEENINKRLFGQEDAIKKVVDSIVMSYSGLKRDNKPIGAFLCVGPTGVGKTELAKSLSDELNMKLIRFDMSEFSDSVSHNKLLGSSPGYVGYNEGGLLFKELKTNPSAVVLFDEFEKAHPSIQNVLLQVLDEGNLKDSKGSVVNFKNTLILLTSNAGVLKSNSELNGMGFSTEHKEAGVNLEEINKIFSPEFRNRLSGIIEFNSLDYNIVKKVAEKAIKEVSDLLYRNRGVKLSWTKGVVEFLAEKGFDPKMGARPIERKIEDLISKKISRLILENDLKDGAIIKIKKHKEDFIFEVI